jgi:hypothetical protein
MVASVAQVVVVVQEIINVLREWLAVNQRRLVRVTGLSSARLQRVYLK